MANGKEMKKIYDAMLRICEETGRMITTVNDMFVDKGFKPVGTSAVMWETSTSYLYPYYWMPYFQQRVFTFKEDQTKGVGINITFDNRNLKNIIPFITCGLIEMGEGQKVNKCDELCMAGLYGSDISKVPETIFYQSLFSNGIKIINYFLPLDLISGPDKVEDFIVKPLISLYNGKESEANEQVKGITISLEDITSEIV